MPTVIIPRKHTRAPQFKSVDWGVFPAVTRGNIVSYCEQSTVKFEIDGLARLFPSSAAIQFKGAARPARHGMVSSGWLDAFNAMTDWTTRNSVNWALSVLVEIPQPLSVSTTLCGFQGDGIFGFWIEGNGSQIRFAGRNSGWESHYSAYVDVPVGRPTLLTFLKIDSGGHRLLIDGVETSARLSSLDVVQLNYPRFTGNASTFDIYYTLVSGGIDKESYTAAMFTLAQNPWLLFRSRSLRLESNAPTSSTHELSADGAGVATGNADLSAAIALSGVGVSIATGAAQASAEIALSALGLAVSSGTADLAGAAVGDLSADGAASASGAASLSASVTISASGLAQAAGAAGMSAAQLVAAAGAAQAAGNAALAAEISAIAAGVATASGEASLSSGVAGDLDAAGSATASGAASLTLTVRLAADGAGQAGGTAMLSGGNAADLSGDGTAVAAGDAVMSVDVVLTAAGFTQAMGAGSLTIQVPIHASGAAQATGTAALTSGAALILISDPQFIVHSRGRRYEVEAPARRYWVGRR